MVKQPQIQNSELSPPISLSRGKRAAQSPRHTRSWLRSGRRRMPLHHHKGQTTEGSSNCSSIRECWIDRCMHCWVFNQCWQARARDPGQCARIGSACWDVAWCLDRSSAANVHCVNMCWVAQVPLAEAICRGDLSWRFVMEIWGVLECACLLVVLS